MAWLEPFDRLLRNSSCVMMCDALIGWILCWVIRGATGVVFFSIACLPRCIILWAAMCTYFVVPYLFAMGSKCLYFLRMPATCVQSLCADLLFEFQVVLSEFQAPSNAPICYLVCDV
ncbi:hypothetical protein LXL04_014899 [Taraxacum kok-saghyz]